MLNHFSGCIKTMERKSNKIKIKKYLLLFHSSRGFKLNLLHIQ